MIDAGDRPTSKQRDSILRQHIKRVEVEREGRFTRLCKLTGAKRSRKKPNQASGGFLPEACDGHISIAKAKRPDLILMCEHGSPFGWAETDSNSEILKALKLPGDYLNIILRKRTPPKRAINEVLGDRSIIMVPGWLTWPGGGGLSTKAAILLCHLRYLGTKGFTGRLREDGAFWQNTKELSRRTGLSPKQLSAAVDELRDWGDLIWRSPITQNRVEHRTYHRLLPGVEELFEKFRQEQASRKENWKSGVPGKRAPLLFEVGITPELVRRFGPNQAIHIGALYWMGETSFEEEGIFYYEAKELRAITGFTAKRLEMFRRSLRQLGVIENDWGKDNSVTWCRVDLSRLKALVDELRELQDRKSTIPSKGTTATSGSPQKGPLQRRRSPQKGTLQDEHPSKGNTARPGSPQKVNSIGDSVSTDSVPSTDSVSRDSVPKRLVQSFRLPLYVGSSISQSSIGENRSRRTRWPEGECPEESSQSTDSRKSPNDSTCAAARGATSAGAATADRAAPSGKARSGAAAVSSTGSSERPRSFRARIGAHLVREEKRVRGGRPKRDAVAKVDSESDDGE
jgi:hypothetical protein